MNLISHLDVFHQQLGSAILIKPLDQKPNAHWVILEQRPLTSLILETCLRAA